MLLTKEQVLKACSLTRDEIIAVMKQAGYDASDIIETEFIGATDCGSFVYRATSPDHIEGGNATGNIYLKHRKDPVKGVYYLDGDY